MINFDKFKQFLKNCTIFALEFYADKNQTKKSVRIGVSAPTRTPCMVDLFVNKLLLRRLLKRLHEPF
jgi:hypothetical protein